jgi:hypothetical protein
LLSTFTTSELSNLLFPLTLPNTPVSLLRIPTGVSTPPPPPLPALPIPPPEQQVSPDDTQQDAVAMNALLNLLLDMGETNIGDFLSN